MREDAIASDVTDLPAGPKTVGLWLPVPVMIIAIFMSSFWLHFIGGAGQDGDAIVLVFPPTWTRTQALTATGALSVPIVDTGRLPFIYAVQPDGVETVRQARAAGALLVLKSPALSLCSGQPQAETKGD